MVAARYSTLMAECADRLLAEAAAQPVTRLDELALLYTVEVTAQAVGLTDSPVPAMARRLVSFFNQPPFDITKDDLGRTRRDWMRAAWNGLLPVLRFYVSDVRPAIRSRRRAPREDVISHLIAEGYTNADILVECVTYGTAGMVTTREFIGMAAWHLLRHPELRDRYLVAEQPERLAILNEIIRLEPVVGHLYRRVQQPLSFDDETAPRSPPSRATWSTCASGRPTPIPRRSVRHRSTSVQMRPLPPGVDEAVLSFGHGAHRCPGQPLAMMESDVLLHRLLARDITIRPSRPSAGTT